MGQILSTHKKQKQNVLEKDTASSITIPSTDTLTNLMVISKNQKESSDSITARYAFKTMNTLFNDYKTEINDDYPLTNDVLDCMEIIFPKFKKQVVDLSFKYFLDGNRTDVLIRKMSTILGPRDNNDCIVSTRKFVYHFAAIIESQMQVLEFCRKEDFRVFDLLEQIALSHMLMGVTLQNFEEFELKFFEFFVSQDVVTDEEVQFFVVFVMTIFGHIRGLMESHCCCPPGLSTSSSPEISVARHNYRIMKNWRQYADHLKETIEPALEKTLRTYPDFMKLTNEDELSNISDDSTIDTQTLKRRDWLMKHFVKKN